MVKGRLLPTLLVGVVVVLVALGAAVLATAASPSRTRGPGLAHLSLQCPKGSRCSPAAPKVLVRDPVALSVVGTAPASGATNVASNTTISVDFSAPVRATGPSPTLSPAVAGSWEMLGQAMLFLPRAPFVPFTTYTLVIPGGSGGLVATDGETLAASDTVTFTIAPGSVTRLQQLLAQLGYLPFSYGDPLPSPTPQDMGLAQPGSLTWRSSDLPAELTGQWTPGTESEITRGAIMSFETQNGLGVDGNAGPAFWASLLADAAAGKVTARSLTYVLVTKTLPQHLTVWVNGVLTFADVPCNTGVAGAITTDGTFAVFQHVLVSNMRGTDVTGSKYDVTVPWASYFHGGQALHGYPRAAYGYPQSNGCVEMPIPTAGKVWPDTPLGTLVTVQ